MDITLLMKLNVLFFLKLNFTVFLIQFSSKKKVTEFCFFKCRPGSRFTPEFYFCCFFSVKHKLALDWSGPGLHGFTWVL